MHSRAAGATLAFWPIDRFKGIRRIPFALNNFENSSKLPPVDLMRSDKLCHPERAFQRRSFGERMVILSARARAFRIAVICVPSSLAVSAGAGYSAALYQKWCF